MAFKTKDNTGSLFKNEEKTNANGPDYSGTCTINGVEHFFDGWIKAAETGRRWMSFSFKAKTKQSSAPAPSNRRSRDDESDEPPF